MEIERACLRTTTSMIIFTPPSSQLVQQVIYNHPASLVQEGKEFAQERSETYFLWYP